MNRMLVASTLVIVLTSGCESVDKEKMGTMAGGLLGAAGGAAAGHFLAKNSTQGMVLGAMAGGLVGVLIGGKVGQYLNEQDRQKHQEAVAKALETGETQVWTNPETGNAGQVVVTDPVPPPISSAPDSAPRPQPVAQAPLCRTTTQTIKLKNGETKTEELKACKGPDGKWEAVGA